MTQLNRVLRLWSFWGTRATFYRDLAESIDQKELLRDFLDGEYQIASDLKTADKRKASALGYMREVMEQGVTELHELLARCMPTGDAMGIAVIADAKDKAVALRYVAANVEQQNEMTQVVRGAIVAPLVLVPIAMAFALVLAGFVIPAFEPVAPPEVWEGFAGLVRLVASLFRTYGVILMALIFLALTWLLAWALPNWTSVLRYQAESAVGTRRLVWLVVGLFILQPVLAIYRDIQSARMLSNLATLLQAGRGLRDALSDLAAKSSPWMRRHLLQVIDTLQLNPGEYSLAFSQGLLSSAMLARLSTKIRRDAGGDFANVLIHIGTMGQVTARDSVSAYAKKMSRILLFSTMGLILFFYIGQTWIVMRLQDVMSPEAIQKRAAMQRSAAARPAP
jgi:hypothetical protein